MIKLKDEEREKRMKGRSAQQNELVKGIHYQHPHIAEGLPESGFSEHHLAIDINLDEIQSHQDADVGLLDERELHQYYHDNMDAGLHQLHYHFNSQR